MAVDPWDEALKQRLGDFVDDGTPLPWDEMARSLADGGEPALADADDLRIREALEHFQADGPVLGWERISSSLDTAGQAFDETIRHKIGGFEAPADPHSWQQFVHYWQDSRFMRTKLILLKGIEAMALLLLLLTVSHYGAFNLYQRPALQAPGETDHRPAMATAPAESTDDVPLAAVSNVPATSSVIADSEPSGTVSTSAAVDNNDIVAEVIHPGLDPALAEADPGIREVIVEPETFDAQELNGQPFDFMATAHPDRPAIDPVESLPSAAVALNVRPGAIPVLAVSQARPRGHAEISLFALTDMSTLRMPEDRIYSEGQLVVFPEKRLTSQGYGGGFTIATGHPRFALETGLMYSARTFSPGRKVLLGTSVDNSTVDFQALRLQLVTIPFQGRLRLDRTGRLQTYATGGMTITVVAQSDLDVVSSYNFSSLAVGADPNSDPVLARTIRESRRISEHLRDGGPFDAKNYLSVNAGFGLEYLIPNHKKLFVQALGQYQIPNLEFSDYDGKDLRALVIQAGIRASLGY